ncbi:hypothetical protein MG293_015054 [Ovis ammon polii]|uniref:Uncharacterized protein n=1 Tax=Ovis ammon polii TaxID=230172 RepID=A0AAD4TXG3_OVIAM|nr:hypothetical protein MG293_015054 [Ovis ammon polii]
MTSVLLEFVQRCGHEDQPYGFWKCWQVLLLSGGKGKTMEVSPASLSTDNIAVNLEPRDCSHQNGGDDHSWNLYKTPFSEAYPPPRWEPIHHGLESFRWNKDVTVTIVYKMRVNIVALYQRAFYSREDYNKDRKCIVPPILLHYHNNAALWLQWGKESVDKYHSYPVMEDGLKGRD